MVLFEKVATADKGIGIVASTAMAPGTLILREEPLITIAVSATGMAMGNDAILPKLASLTEAQKAAFMGLHNSVPRTILPPFQGIIATNSFGLGEVGSKQESGVFAIASRFNHSCSPNAEFFWVEDTKCLEIRAVKTIAEKEEICVSYLGDRGDAESNQPKAFLRNRYFFECQCEACSLPIRERNADDAKRIRILKMDEALGGGGLIASDPAKALKFCRELLKLRKALGRGRQIHRAYYDAFQVCAAHGDSARASALMKLHNESKSLYEGSISERDRAYAWDPSHHRLFGRVSMKWRSSIKNAKSPLDNGFEEWLWKKAEK